MLRDIIKTVLVLLGVGAVITITIFPFTLFSREQIAANEQITQGVVTNKSAETYDRLRTETTYTIYIRGDYIYRGESKQGERAVVVDLDTYLKYGIGDYYAEEGSE